MNLKKYTPMEIDVIIEKTEKQILDFTKKSKRNGSIADDIATKKAQALEVISQRRMKVEAAILEERQNPSKSQQTAGIVIRIPDPEKLDKENNNLKGLKKHEEITISVSDALLPRIKKGTKVIKAQRRKIKRIQKHLDKLGLPYMAVVPYDMLEKIVESFNFFHFRNSDFSADGRIMMPRSKFKVAWIDGKALLNKKTVADAYQGKISKCLFGNDCQGCNKICKMKKVEVPEIDENYDFSRYSKNISYWNKDRWHSINLWAIKIYLPQPDEETQKKIRPWIAKCDPKHIFTIADQGAVDVDPTTVVKNDPIIGYDLGKMKKRYKGYAALIIQYGEFIEEKQAVRTLVAYYQEILGKGINLGAAIN